MKSLFSIFSATLVVLTCAHSATIEEQKSSLDEIAKLIISENTDSAKIHLTALAEEFESISLGSPEWDELAGLHLHAGSIAKLGQVPANWPTLPPKSYAEYHNLGEIHQALASDNTNKKSNISNFQALLKPDLLSMLHKTNYAVLRILERIGDKESFQRVALLNNENKYRNFEALPIIEGIGYAGQDIFDLASPIVHIGDADMIATVVAQQKGAVLEFEIQQDNLLVSSQVAGIDPADYTDIFGEQLPDDSGMTFRELNEKVQFLKFSNDTQNLKLKTSLQKQLDRKRQELSLLSQVVKSFPYASENITEYYLQLIETKFGHVEKNKAIAFSNEQDKIHQQEATHKPKKSKLDSKFRKFLTKVDPNTALFIDTKTHAIAYYLKNKSKRDEFASYQETAYVFMRVPDRVNFSVLANAPNPEWAIEQIHELNDIFIDFVIEMMSKLPMIKMIIQLQGEKALESKIQEIRANARNSFTEDQNEAIPSGLRNSALSTLISTSMLPSLNLPMIGNQDSSGLQAYSKKASKIRARLYAEIPNSLYSSKSLNSTFTPKSISKNLSDDDFIVEFFSYNKPNAVFGINMVKHYGVVIIDSNGFTQFVDVGASETIDEVILKTRNNLTNPNATPELENNLKALYESVWGNVSDVIGTKTKKVYISLTGKLNNVPFPVLIDKNNNFLIESTNIHIINSTKDLVEERNSKPTNSLAERTISIVSNPRYFETLDESFDNSRLTVESLIYDLPATKVEAEDISILAHNATFEVVSIGEEKATENNFRNLPASEIVHIATHGFHVHQIEEIAAEEAFVESFFTVDLSNTNLTSGIALTNAGETIAGWAHVDPETNSPSPLVNDFGSDGWLSVYEFFQLNYQSTNLVFLSACDTGFSTNIVEGEGALSIARAFKRAGAKNIIYTLWPVGEENALKFSTAFYKMHIAQNLDVSTAYIETQKQLLVKAAIDYDSKAEAAKMYGCFAHSFRN